MTEVFINQFLAQVLGYGAFVLLLLYTLTKQEERDEKSEQRELNYQQRELNYQKIIDEAMKKLNIVTIIKQDIDEIKAKIRNKEEE